MSDHTEFADLLAAIADAFPPHPLDPSQAKRAWAGGYLDVVAFREGLVGRRWDELDRVFMEFHGETIHFLKPPVFAELLPAYLVTVLRHEAQLDMLPTFLLSALTPPMDGSDLQPNYAVNMASLTPGQQQVVARALDWLRQHAASEDVSDAAARAWRGFSAGVAR